MRVVFFSYFFPPDLSAGSFRAESISKSLAKKLDNKENPYFKNSNKEEVKSTISDLAKIISGESEELINYYSGFFDKNSVLLISLIKFRTF